MTYKIYCPFTVESSHDFQVIGFLGMNTTALVLPVIMESPFGALETSMEIGIEAEGKYFFRIDSETLDSHEKQVDFIEAASGYLSFLLALDEVNPQHGTAFIAPQWSKFTAHLVRESEQLQNECNLSGNITIETRRKFELSGRDYPKTLPTELLRFYADGLRAEHEKSKFFHWFLMLEYLEYTDKYNAMFESSSLFEAAEAEAITKLANTMDSTKRSALRDLLKRTKEFRSFKLAALLEQIGVTEINTDQDRIKLVTEQMIKSIMQGRNALFHSGRELSDGLLWRTLYPLVTRVLQRVFENPSCLTAELNQSQVDP